MKLTLFTLFSLKQDIDMSSYKNEIKKMKWNFLF